RTETRATTAWILGHIAHLLHPIMPFITEEVWQNLGGKDARLLLISPWPEFGPEARDLAAATEMEWVVQAISSIRALRAEMSAPPAPACPAAHEGGGPPRSGGSCGSSGALLAAGASGSVRAGSDGSRGWCPDSSRGCGLDLVPRRCGRSRSGEGAARQRNRQ